MDLEAQQKLWKYLVKRLRKLEDDNYTARLIFDKVIYLVEKSYWRDWYKSLHLDRFMNINEYLGYNPRKTLLLLLQEHRITTTDLSDKLSIDDNELIDYITGRGKLSEASKNKLYTFFKIREGSL